MWLIHKNVFITDACQPYPKMGVLFKDFHSAKKERNLIESQKKAN